jgi:hypothetical protein
MFGNPETITGGLALKENPAMEKEIVAKIMAQNKDGRAHLVVVVEEQE